MESKSSTWRRKELRQCITGFESLGSLVCSGWARKAASAVRRGLEELSIGSSSAQLSPTQIVLESDSLVMIGSCLFVRFQVDLKQIFHLYVFAISSRDNCYRKVTTRYLLELCFRRPCRTGRHGWLCD